MKTNKLKSLLLTCILAVALVIPAFAVDNGPYSVATNTFYLNPDTGVTDDGGTKNAALGEGMCRSVIDPTALIEIDGDTIYLTLRILLMSNIQNFTLDVQATPGDPDSYYTVYPEIMLEDGGMDSMDLRFEIPTIGCYIRGTAYIIPMVRDVCFYLNTDTALTPYEGNDFIVTVQAGQSSSEPEAPAVEDVLEETPVDTEELPQEDPMIEADNDEAIVEEEELLVEDNAPEDVQEEVSEPTTAPEDLEPTETTTEENAEETVQTAPQETTSILPLICVAIVVIAGVVFFVLYKKRK